MGAGDGRVEGGEGSWGALVSRRPLTRAARPCPGWPRPLLMPGVTPGVAVITSIGVGLMVQPRVMGVATEANVTVEKAMDQHGKQNTKKIILE